MTILAATGNENASTISYPAIHQDVIGVGAASPCGDRKRSSSSAAETNSGVNTDPNGYTCDGERWWGSNYGSSTPDARGAVDIIAPTILTTTDIAGAGGYQSGDYEPFFNGTSAATPYAAGVCALIISANPGWSPTQVRDQLVNTAPPSGEGYILSRNPDFSTDDRSFTTGETMYMKLWTDQVDFNDIKKERWEMKDPNGTRIRENLTNHGDGTWTAAFALSGLPSNDTTWTWKGQVEDQPGARYRPTTTVTVTSGGPAKCTASSWISAACSGVGRNSRIWFSSSQ